MVTVVCSQVAAKPPANPVQGWMPVESAGPAKRPTDRALSHVASAADGR